MLPGTNTALSIRQYQFPATAKLCPIPEFTLQTPRLTWFSSYRAENTFSLGYKTHQSMMSFIHCAVCRTTAPQPLPKPVLHTVRSSASSSNFQYPLLSLRSSSSCLRLLPRLPTACILPMLYREIIAVCSQIHTKHLNTLCGQNAEFVNVKLVVHIVTTGLQSLKTLL